MAAKPLCSILDCGKTAYMRGWCRPHYSRWQRHGDPLGGRTSRGKARQFFEKTVLPYEGNDCLKWPFALDRSGYGRIGYDGKIHVVSRLVCELVNGEPPSSQHDAAHSCGNGHLGCVNPRHLRWASRKENVADMVAHGTKVRGSLCVNTKLTEADVLKIRRLAETMPQVAIAKKFGISETAVRGIKTRRRWAWL